MKNSQKIALTLLRVSIGFLFLYAGIAKLIDPAWTSAGYLMSAQTMAGLYDWLASPGNIVWVDLLNKWGLFLIGISMVLGLGTRIAATLGSLLMALYYIPTLNFPYAGAHAYIIDEHIVYIFAFIVLVVFNAGMQWGMDGMIDRSKVIPAKWKKCLLCK